MISRRDALIGVSCLATAGGAMALKPRNHIQLLGSQKLDQIIPKRIGAWEDQPSSAIVAPPPENSLAAKLYNQTLGRFYTQADGPAIMLLIAYGSTQSDTLQLHRPEVCYPAFGFEVTKSRPHAVPLFEGETLPAREMVANIYGRQENVLYWTRIGEMLPDSGSAQRMAKFQSQLRGIVPDGVLVRISNNLTDPVEGLRQNELFALAMLRAARPSGLPALIGTEDARLIGRFRQA